MNSPTFIVAISLSIIAGLVFTAGSDAFGFLPEKVANFSGIVVGSAAAVAWMVHGASRKKGRREP